MNRVQNERRSRGGVPHHPLLLFLELACCVDPGQGLEARHTYYTPTLSGVSIKLAASSARTFLLGKSLARRSGGAVCVPFQGALGWSCGSLVL